MSYLLNYLPCPKCLKYSSNIIKLENKVNGKENDLFLKLSCVQNCSINCIKFSELKQLLNNQEKIPTSPLIHGNFSHEQDQIENISAKIFNKINNVYCSIEKIEKEILKLKEEVKKEIFNYKKGFEDFRLLHEIIYGAYLKNIKDNKSQENQSYLNNNLKFININDNNNYNIENYFYFKEIEKDILTIDSSINSVKNEIFIYLKNNQIISINEKYNKNKCLFSLVDFSLNNNSYSKIEKHNTIKKYNTRIKNIETIIKLSDGNIALGSYDEMSIYNLELKKEIANIPGEFWNIRELKYYKNMKNLKNIIILSLQSKRIKIYDIYDKKILLNYSQYYNIDSILELYNGDILYICDYNIHNINLKEEFNIPLKFFCYSMINLYDKQNILGYTSLSKLNFVYLEKPKKIIKEIDIKNSKEIYDLKQIYDDNINTNYLIILSDKSLDLYNLNSNQFIFKSKLCIENNYKNLFISKGSNNNTYIIGENSIQFFILKNNKFIHIHTIDSLKSKKKSILYHKNTTPFSINNNGQYLLIFDSNDEGFNTL